MIDDPHLAAPAPTMLAAFTVVQGVASPTWRAAFVDDDVGSATGATWVRCSHDELHGVIARIEDLGLDLLEIRLLTGLAATSMSRSS